MRVRLREAILLALAGCRDADCDGFDPVDDCDDSDRHVHPGAGEVCGNDIDVDCDRAAGACGFDVAVADWPRMAVGAGGAYGLPDDGDVRGAILVTTDASSARGALVGRALGAGRRPPATAWTLDGGPLDELGAALAVGEPGWLAGAPGRGAAGHGGVDRIDDAGRVLGTIVGTEPFARLGASVGVVDGAVVAGAPYASRGGAYAGAVYGFDAIDGTRDDLEADAVILGDVPGGRFGAALVGADDVGDGRDRLFAVGGDPEGLGQVYRFDDPRGALTVADGDVVAVEDEPDWPEAWRICAADLDGDGREEVVFRFRLSGCVADLDGDGRAGVVVGGAYLDGERTVPLAPWTVGSVGAADLDGDGFPDLWLGGARLEVILGGPGL